MDHDRETYRIDSGFAVANALMLKSLNLLEVVGGKWRPIYLPDGKILPCYKALRCFGHFQRLLRLNANSRNPETRVCREPLR